jgi:hypothetical protein
MSALLGESKHGRSFLVEQGRALALRQGNWKLILPTANANDRPQLYNLADDLGESRNLAAKQPAKVKELSALFDRIRSSPTTRDFKVN